MSGGPGIEPPCVGKSYAGTFLNPQAADTLHLGDTITVSWYAGKNGEYTNRTQTVGLVLSSEAADPPLKLLDHALFQFAYYPQGSNITWNIIDQCSNTAMTFNWTIPTTLNVTNQPKFLFNAYNESGSQQNYGIASSGPFLIQARPTEGAAPSTTTTGHSNGTTGPSGPPNSSSPGPASSSAFGDLPIGVRAGVGVGIGLASVLLLAGLVWFCRWRRRPKVYSAPPGQSPWNKAELDGNAVDPQRTEADGAVITELEAPQIIRELRGSEWVHDPVGPDIGFGRNPETNP